MNNPSTIHCGPPLFTLEATVTLPEVLCQDALPYSRRTSFRTASSCWWRPPGWKRPSNEESSLTDCVSQCSWTWKDYPKINSTHCSCENSCHLSYYHRITGHSLHFLVLCMTLHLPYSMEDAVYTVIGHVHETRRFAVGSSEESVTARLCIPAAMDITYIWLYTRAPASLIASHCMA